MLTVKKFNPISDIVYTQMPQDRYRFIEDGEDYDVALVRSAELGRTQFPKQLLAIAGRVRCQQHPGRPMQRRRDCCIQYARRQCQCGQGTGAVRHDAGLPADCAWNSVGTAAAQRGGR